MKIKHERSKIILKSLSMNMLYKVIGLVLSYVTIPILIDYLSVEKYGVWVTIISILSWTNMLDIGIGNGLRNKLPKCFVNEDYEEANKYISTAYITLSLFILFITIIISLFIPFFNWQKIFGTTILSNKYLIVLMLVIFISYMINFILSLCNSLYYGVQKSEVPAKRILYHNIMYLILIMIIRGKIDGSLLVLAILYQGTAAISYIVITIKFFKENRKLVVHKKYYDKRKNKDILNVGIKFFVLQITSMVIFTTDNIIISTVLGPSAVTNYSIAQKLFGIIGTAFALILTPLWSAYTQAYVQKDYNWIKSVIKKLNLFLILIIIGTIGIVGLFNFIVDIWIGPEIQVDRLLIILTAIYTIISCWNNIYAYLLNGIGVLNLSLVVAVLGAVINIPLSVILATKFNMGSGGVIIATIVSLLFSAVTQPIQVYLILKEKKIKNKKINKILLE